MKNEEGSPYLNARKEHLDHMGKLITARNDYRLMAFCGFAIAVICAGGMIYLGTQQKVVPFMVEFNEHSEVSRVTRADVMAQPNVNQIKSALRDWVIGARSVWGDRRAQEHMINTTYAMTLPDSSGFLTLASYHEQNNPFKRSSHVAVEVAVNSVMLIGGDTWRVEWTETTKQISGRVLDTKTWQGSFTVVVVPPTDEKQILINPLGVYVKDFTWVTRL
ncbi:MAG: type IV secretion system protein [Devosia sp.]